MANLLATIRSGWGMARVPVKPDLGIEVHSVLQTAERGTGHEYSGVSGPSSLAPSADLCPSARLERGERSQRSAYTASTLEGGKDL